MSTTLREGHVLSVLEGLPAGHFHCAVTSPPYWQLRNYGSEPQVWDGAAGCEHDWSAYVQPGKSGGLNSAKLAIKGTQNFQVTADTDAAFCARCGAWRGELGQEPDPELYVAHLVAMFDSVRRVLRDDGTLWVNLAGSYWSEPGGQNGGSRPNNNGQGSSTLYAALARTRVGREPLSLFASHGGEAADAPPPEPEPVNKTREHENRTIRGLNDRPHRGGEGRAAPEGATKQERHPNRTVAGFNQRWNASKRPVGSILPLEEQDGALVDG